ncbi:hypothetical protein GCM10018954_086170 [Kutzneria kofuensis]
MRRQLSKVFPTHWSFLLGEIALYSFIVLLLTGTYLALFFDPSLQEVTYSGTFSALRGVPMSRAFQTTVDLSFDVRGGLFVRQIHHWAALLFMAAILCHMARIFLTGAFRKPRELNWVIGVTLFTLGMAEGFAGYSLPDDLLSGTGLRIMSGIVQSIPVIGTWLHWLVFGGESPARSSTAGSTSPTCSWCRASYPGPGRRAPRGGVVPEAHPVPGHRPHRAQRGRGPDRADLRLAQRGLVHGRRGRAGCDGRHLPDQSRVELRALPSRPGLVGFPARLVHRLARRLGPPDARLAHRPVRTLAHPARVLADGRAAVDPDQLRRALSVWSSAGSPRTRRGTTCCSGPGTCPSAPRWAPWR